MMSFLTNTGNQSKRPYGSGSAGVEKISLNQGAVQQDNGQTSRMNTQEHMFGKSTATHEKTDGATYKLNADNSITKTVNGKDYMVSTADRRYDRVNQEMRDAAVGTAVGVKKDAASYKLNADHSINKTVNGKDYVVTTADSRYQRVNQEMREAATSGNAGIGSAYSARKEPYAYLSSGKSSGKQDYSDIEVRNANVSQGNGVAYDAKTGNISITTPEGHKTVLQYGRDYYIADKKAYYTNDKTKAIVAVGDNKNSTWAISKDGSTIRNKQNNYRLFEGQDYYIGADGVAYFYSDVRSSNASRGIGVAWMGHKIGLENSSGRVYYQEEGRDYYIGADGKAHYFNGPPSPNPAYWEEADDDADPNWLDEDDLWTIGTDEFIDSFNPKGPVRPMGWNDKVEEIFDDEEPGEDIGQNGTDSNKEVKEEGFAYNWTGEYVTPEFKDKVIEISAKLQMNPDDLMAIMAFESNLNPTAHNPSGSATGLIQFVSKSAKRLGVTTDELAEMTAVEQMDYVYQYFKPYTGKIDNIYDVYMIVLLPVAVGKDNSYVIGEKGSTECFPGTGLSKGTVYDQNSGLDINKDGIITKGEAGQKVINKISSYEKIE